jgi:hypothetical protein
MEQLCSHLLGNRASICSFHAWQYNVSPHALNVVTGAIRHYILSHTATVQQWAWFDRNKLHSQMKPTAHQPHKYSGQFVYTILLE